MDQPVAMVANPARGQLTRENIRYFFPCLRSRLRIWYRETGSPSRPAPVFSFSTLRLNLVLTHGIPPDFRGCVHLLIYTVPPYAIGSVLSLSGHTKKNSRESAGTGPVVLKVVPVTGAAFSGFTIMGHFFVRLSFSTPTTGM